MAFGRFDVGRGGSVFAFSLMLLCGLTPKAWTQQPAAPPSSGIAPVPTLPAAQPLSEAARGTGTRPPAAADSSQNTGPEQESGGGVTSPMLKLGNGDLIEVGVYNVPELTTKARVGTSGDVYLPLIDYVHVGDLTVEEAQTVIERRLEAGGFVRNAHVTIFVDESISQGVTVLGEVVRPGIYPPVGDRKLFSLISAAGGFTSTAGRKVSIIRQHSDGSPITVNLPRNFADDIKDNIEIRPGDTVSVPRAPIIYVVGDVGRPTGLLVDNGSLTVLQALALAGGTNHTAKMGATRIIHRGPQGMTETKVPLKKMLEAKAPDVNLEADDILFVPLSGMRVAGEQAMQAAISAATGIAVIAAHP